MSTTGISLREHCENPEERINRIRREMFPEGFYRLDWNNEYNVALGYATPGMSSYRHLEYNIRISLRNAKMIMEI